MVKIKKTTLPLVALVVDDLPSMRWIVARRLREMGFSIIIEAGDADIAIEKLSLGIEKGVRIDLIVSDLHMPNMGGIEFPKLVKSFPEFENIPFIILADISREGIYEDLERIGEVDYVPKPIRSQIFKSRVKEALALYDFNKIISAFDAETLLQDLKDVKER